MPTAIILHGMPKKEEYFNPDSPSQSNKHWLPWLQKQLILNGILAQTPELPEPYDPVYKKWCSVFERFQTDQDTMLVGHSCGAGFLVRWLSENKVQVGKVALVAPFLDPDHDEVRSDLFQFQIDQDLIQRTKGVAIFVSSDDEQEILTSVQQLQSTLKGVKTITLSGMGHLTFSDMKTDQFPELRDWLVGGKREATPKIQK